MTKATNKHSENVTFIACPGKQWLRERLNVTLAAGPNRIVTSVVYHPAGTHATLLFLGDKAS